MIDLQKQPLYETQKPVLSNQEIAEKIKKVADSNGYKRGTKKFRTCEFSFLQGMIVADNRYLNNALIIICITTGRSMLD